MLRSSKKLLLFLPFLGIQPIAGGSQIFPPPNMGMILQQMIPIQCLQRFLHKSPLYQHNLTLLGLKIVLVLLFYVNTTQRCVANFYYVKKKELSFHSCIICFSLACFL